MTVRSNKFSNKIKIINLLAQISSWYFPAAMYESNIKNIKKSLAKNVKCKNHKKDVCVTHMHIKSRMKRETMNQKLAQKYKFKHALKILKGVQRRA